MNRMLMIGTALLAVSLRVVAAEPAISWKLFSSAAIAPAAGEVGKKEFQNACAICHGPGAPGTMSLEFKYRGSRPALLEERTDLTAEVVQYFIRHGVAMMPFYRKTELNDAQAAVIADYLSRRTR